MSDTITLPTPVVGSISLQSKWEREHEAFRRLLPQLLNTHRGKYVAIHEGQVVGCSDAKLPLALEVLAKVGNVAIHVGLVTEKSLPIARSGVRREFRPGGDEL